MLTYCFRLKDLRYSLRHEASEPLIYGIFKAHTDERSGTSTCLETDTDGDLNLNKMIKNKRIYTTYSSSSEMLDNLSEWDDNEEIIYHAFTELEVPKDNESNKEKRERRKSRRIKSDDGTTVPPQEIIDDPGLQRYWLNRYELFHRYDEGIQLDKGRSFIYLCIFEKREIYKYSHRYKYRCIMVMYILQRVGIL